MRIPAIEPLRPRYIYINPKKNLVHLLVPVVRGQEISTDNTCKTHESLTEFFDKGAALSELTSYQSALEFDLLFLNSAHPLKIPKQQRLAQIKEYIKALSAMQVAYPEEIIKLLRKPSNLYSIQLNPREQDPQSTVVNPVFTVERNNDATGTPLSFLYRAMYREYSQVKMSWTKNPKAQLIHAVLALMPSAIDFQLIQNTLREECLRLFHIDIDFSKFSDKKSGVIEVTKEYIDNFMGFDCSSDNKDLKPQHYLDALLGICAPELFKTISSPPFYRIEDNEDKTEKLSILTQFFLAHLTIYCRANKISESNLGAILDASSTLSDEVARTVRWALNAGESVEENLCFFFNEKWAEFGSSRPLTQNDIESIKQKFNRTYTTVTATKENPHMDDFMILDTEVTEGIFVTHQGAICTDFSELLHSTTLDNDFFKIVRADFEAQYVPNIPHQNDHVKADIQLNMETLLSSIQDNNVFNKLPKPIQEACLKSPLYPLHRFLNYVAQGKQDEAEDLLKETPQILLITPGKFTDYSGRTFTCTAYEYAYWAKDTHMRRLLERYMDSNTQAILLKRIHAMHCIDSATNQPVGLVYQQGGIRHQSLHYDFTPLKQALKTYIEGYKAWNQSQNYEALEAAWMNVGKAQRNVPAHVIHEYCRPDRAFFPLPTFDEETLPRVFTFYNYGLDSALPLYPLGSDFSGLGKDFALGRGNEKRAIGPSGGRRRRAGAGGGGAADLMDLAAIEKLEAVRTNDLLYSYKRLNAFECKPTEEPICSLSVGV